MSVPVVLRVEPVYEKPKGRKRTLARTASHNSRTDGDFRHVDPERTHLNQVLLGTGDVVADVQAIASQYPRSSKSGPIAGEVIMTAQGKFFKKMSEAERAKWARDSLAWAIQEFDKSGAGIVASCHWHRDEGAEHLHITVVPVATGTKGNQYHRKTVTEINYSLVLGKPPGGEKDLPPDQRRWGLKQTSYAEYMASCGHDLIRGVRNRKAVNKSPIEWRAEINTFFSDLTQRMAKMQDDGERVEFTKTEIAQFIFARTQVQTQNLTAEQKRLLTQVESLQQALSDSAKELGCPNPAQLPQYASDLMRTFLADEPNARELFRNFATQGAEARQAEEVQKRAKEEAARRVTSQQRPRSVSGQRKSTEERRAARAARKACPDWLVAQRNNPHIIGGAPCPIMLPQPPVQ